MVNLLLSILGSLIAAALVILGSALLSRTARRVLTVAASELLGLDVKYVFPSGRASESVVSRELASSLDIRVFAGRGNDFQGTLYAPLLDPTTKPLRKCRVLLPNVYHTPRGFDWIAQRDGELARADASYGKGQLRRQIRTSIEHIEHHVDGTHFQLRLFDLPHVGRIILTERFAFFTPYADARHGRDSRVFQYGRGDMYDALGRFFEMVWPDSSELAVARGLNGPSDR